MPRPVPIVTRAAPFVITTLAFGGAFGLQRFHDDWVLPAAAGAATREHAVAGFIWSPFGRHWSPLWHAYEALNLRAVGWERDILIRITIALMVAAALFVFSWNARRIGLSQHATLVGLGVLGWHHVNAGSYYSFDCYSQVAADLLTWTAVSLALGVAFDDRRPRSVGRLSAAVTLYIAALLFKEQALAAAMQLAVICGWCTFVEPRRARRSLWGLFAAVVVISAAFAAVRTATGLSLDTTGAASLCWSCVPGNIGLLLGGVLLPVRTLDAYFALIAPGSDLTALATAAAGTLAVVLLLALGLTAYRRTAPEGRRIVLFGALVVASFFPTAVLAHVGELYAHTAVFWFALLGACAVDGWRARLRSGSANAARTGAAIAAVYLMSLYVGLQMNLADMRATGMRAAGWLAEFRAAQRAIPRGSTVLVRGLAGQKGPRDYGLYRLTTVGPLLGEGSTGLQLANPDLVVIDDDAAVVLPDLAARQTRGLLFIADFTAGRLALRPATPGEP